MILVIDSSSPSRSALAAVDGETSRELFSPRFDLDAARSLVRSSTVTRVAVATGPGSFTGLRAGVSFGLGLAVGLGVPIVALPSLELQAARSVEPATAVVEAGRGRFYYRPAGGGAALADPAGIPTRHPLVGFVGRPESLVAAGHRFVAEDMLRSFTEAALRTLETAREVPYRNLEIEYMQSFSPRKV
jgi:tRNA A37 threonylcarbamoyladenosine modification protein TsaB